jgi:O-antigen ligase
MKHQETVFTFTGVCDIAPPKRLIQRTVMNSKRGSSSNNDRGFYSLVAIWLFLVIISGGITIPAFTLWAAHVLTALALLVWALFRLRDGFPTALSMAGAALLLAGLCLALLQIVPLPPAVWTLLPGRELVAQTYVNAGIVQPALPMSLLPGATLESATAFVFALAIFCATLTLPRRGLLAVFMAMLAAAAVSAVLALLQKAQGPNSVWYLYSGLSASSPSGIFGNKNFYATQIFTAIPILGAIATTLHEEYRIRKLVLNLLLVVAVCLLLAGLALSGSRAGIILAMISLMMTIFFVYRPFQSGGMVGSFGAAAIATLVGVLVVGQASMLGFLRFAASDPLSDYRWTIFAVTKRAITAFLPLGSGFGSFVPVYQMFEKPGEVIDAYANHAHNEWLELALEGGFPAVLLVAAAVLLLLIAVFRLVNSGRRNTTKVLQWAALVVIMLFMAHATVDFGIRTPALMAVLTVCCAILSLAGGSARHQTAASQREDALDFGRSQPPPQFRPARERFGRPATPDDMPA